MDLTTISGKELLKLWDSESKPEVRTQDLEEMQKPSRKLFVSNYEDKFERSYGLHPDIDDKHFFTPNCFANVNF
jgi:hypothetical protein